ncbi:MAG: PIG-L family deacetylase, partial [Acholeplasmataceae bacterium]|nr:PIG-L family deacetylase [Acholeplasmataceae bacterium]
LYTHNLADKHDTHIGVTTKVIRAIRLMDKKIRPKAVYGCEVWRDLDWMNDSEKVIFNVSGRPNLSQALVEVFDSQITGGKRYDLATAGRRMANATYSSSHSVDQADEIILGMDLTPLIIDDSLDMNAYVLEYIERFKLDVEKRIKKML